MSKNIQLHKNNTVMLAIIKEQIKYELNYTKKEEILDAEILKENKKFYSSKTTKNNRNLLLYNYKA